MSYTAKEYKLARNMYDYDRKRVLNSGMRFEVTWDYYKHIVLVEGLCQKSMYPFDVTSDSGLFRPAIILNQGAEAYTDDTISIILKLITVNDFAKLKHFIEYIKISNILDG